jgi:hypothetical protein
MPGSLTLFSHQDTWHRDQLAFDEDQLQNLSTMLVGTSYCAFSLVCRWPRALDIDPRNKQMPELCHGRPRIDIVYLLHV